MCRLQLADRPQTRGFHAMVVLSQGSCVGPPRRHCPFFVAWATAIEVIWPPIHCNEVHWGPLNSQIADCRATCTCLEEKVVHRSHFGRNTVVPYTQPSAGKWPNAGPARPSGLRSLTAVGLPGEADHFPGRVTSAVRAQRRLCYVMFCSVRQACRPAGSPTGSP
jgi:hypothetical protein